MTKTEKPAYWIIKFTGIDGKTHELKDFSGATQKFTRHYAAIDWTDTMPEWQKPEVIPVYL